MASSSTTPFSLGITSAELKEIKEKGLGAEQIYYALSSYIKEKNLSNAQVVYCRNAFRFDANYLTNLFKEQNIKPHAKRFLIFPFTENNRHFVLFVVDHQTKTISYLDPEARPVRPHSIIHSVAEQLKQQIRNVEDYCFLALSSRQQNDPWSCGVHTIMNTLEIIDDEINLKNPDTIKKTLNRPVELYLKAIFLQIKKYEKEVIEKKDLNHTIKREVIAYLTRLLPTLEAHPIKHALQNFQFILSAEAKDPHHPHYHRDWLESLDAYELEMGTLVKLKSALEKHNEFTRLLPTSPLEGINKNDTLFRAFRTVIQSILPTTPIVSLSSSSSSSSRKPLSLNLVIKNQVILFLKDFESKLKGNFDYPEEKIALQHLRQALESEVNHPAHPDHHRNWLASLDDYSFHFNDCAIQVAELKKALGENSEFDRLLPLTVKEKINDLLHNAFIRGVCSTFPEKKEEKPKAPLNLESAEFKDMQKQGLTIEQVDSILYARFKHNANVRVMSYRKGTPLREQMEKQGIPLFEKRKCIIFIVESAGKPSILFGIDHMPTSSLSDATPSTIYCIDSGSASVEPKKTVISELTNLYPTYQIENHIFTIRPNDNLSYSIHTLINAMEIAEHTFDPSDLTSLNRRDVIQSVQDFYPLLDSRTSNHRIKRKVVECLMMIEDKLSYSKEKMALSTLRLSLETEAQCYKHPHYYRCWLESLDHYKLIITGSTLTVETLKRAVGKNSMFDLVMSTFPPLENDIIFNAFKIGMDSILPSLSMDKKQEEKPVRLEEKPKETPRLISVNIDAEDRKEIEEFGLTSEQMNGVLYSAFQDNPHVSLLSYCPDVPLEEQMIKQNISSEAKPGDFLIFSMISGRKPPVFFIVDHAESLHHSNMMGQTIYCLTSGSEPLEPMETTALTQLRKLYPKHILENQILPPPYDRMDSKTNTLVKAIGMINPIHSLIHLNNKSILNHKIKMKVVEYLIRLERDLSFTYPKERLALSILRLSLETECQHQKHPHRYRCWLASLEDYTLNIRKSTMTLDTFKHAVGKGSEFDRLITRLTVRSPMDDTFFAAFKRGVGSTLPKFIIPGGPSLSFSSASSTPVVVSTPSAPGGPTIR